MNRSVPLKVVLGVVLGLALLVGVFFSGVAYENNRISNEFEKAFGGTVSDMDVFVSDSLSEDVDGDTDGEFGSGFDPTTEPDAEADTEGDAPPDGEADVPVLAEGQVTTLGPDDNGGRADVTLLNVSYPQPRAGADRPNANRVFVAVELKVENTGADDVYGVNVYPDFQTAGGQVIGDTGWVVAPNGAYGSTPETREELVDTVGVGQFAQGWSLYEIPPEPGTLIFPYGPGAFQVMVDPPDA